MNSTPHVLEDATGGNAPLFVAETGSHWLVGPSCHVCVTELIGGGEEPT